MAALRLPPRRPVPVPVSEPEPEPEPEEEEIVIQGTYGPGTSRVVSVPKRSNQQILAEPIIEDRAEVTIYDSLTNGRAELEAVCRERGLSWGIISYSTGPGTIQARVIVGTVHEIESAGQALDACLLELAEHLRSE